MSLLRTRLVVLTVIILGMHLGTIATAAALCCHEACQMAVPDDADCHDAQAAAMPGAMCHIVASASDADGRLATIECACGDHDAAVNALLGPLGLVAARVIVDVAIAPLHAIEGPTGTSADWLPPNTSPPPQR